MPSARREIRIVNEARNLVLVRREFSAFLDDSPFPKKDKNKLILATDEAIANVVEHAYGPELGLVCVTFMLDDEKMTVRVADNGIKFKPKILILVEMGRSDMKLCQLNQNKQIVLFKLIKKMEK